MNNPLQKKRKKKKTRDDFRRPVRYKGKPPLKHGRYSIITFGGGGGFPRLD